MDGDAIVDQPFHSAPNVIRVAAQPVQLGNQQDVSFLQSIHQPCEEFALHSGDRAGDCLGKHSLRLNGEPCGADLSYLVVGSLVGGADPVVFEGSRQSPYLRVLEWSLDTCGGSKSSSTNCSTQRCGVYRTQ